MEERRYHSAYGDVSPVIRFRFDRLRQVLATHLHCTRQFSLQLHVPSRDEGGCNGEVVVNFPTKSLSAGRIFSWQATFEVVAGERSRVRDQFARSRHLFPYIPEQHTADTPAL